MAKQTPGDIAAVIIWLLIVYIKKPAEFLQLLKKPHIYMAEAAVLL